MAKRTKKKKSKRKKKKRKSIRKKIRRRTKKTVKRTSTVSKKTSKETVDADGNVVFNVSENWSKQAYINKSQYEKKYKLSIKENENFWRKEGKSKRGHIRGTRLLK